MDDTYNGEAFPRDLREDVPGMLLRDWFAGQFLQGILVTFWQHGPGNQDLAKAAYELADEMMGAREK